MTLSSREIEKQLREAKIWYDCTEYRDIGINIACYDEDNEALPCPIKICNMRPEGTAKYYKNLPASEGHPYQGLD